MIGTNIHEVPYFDALLKMIYFMVISNDECENLTN